MELEKTYFFLLIGFCWLCKFTFCSTPEHQSFDEFSKEVLKIHNEHRKVHNGEGFELELDDDMNKEARALAKKAARDSEILEHPPSGHNVFMACSTYNRALTGKEVTDSWYDEVCHPTFKFANPDNKQSRSFTQVVWKGSKKLGVGHAVTRKENTICTYAIAIYKPVGNIAGNYTENVQQGSFQKEKYCPEPHLDNVKAKRSKPKKKVSKKNHKGGDKTQFVLNKNPPKPMVNRRTLYYKIPVNFVTASDTGSTFVVPRKEQLQEESGFRRSQPTLPEFSTAFDPDSLKYREYGNEKSNLKDEVRKNSDNEENNEEDPDVQADYIRERLDQEKEQVLPEQQNFFQKPINQDESDVPSFENIKMVKPQRKTIEDEYAVNKIALEVHNALRKIHKAPALKLSPKISIAAENYAKYLAESNKFEHAKNIAENLAFSCNKEGRIPSVAEAVKDWYQEVCLKDFDFEKDPSLPGTAHFTQIVWESTKLLGIGRAIVKRGEQTCTYFVARYEPAGNWVGQFREKVKKGNFNSSICKNLTAIVRKAAGNFDEKPVVESSSSKPKPINDDDKNKEEENKNSKQSKKPEDKDEDEIEKPIGIAQLLPNQNSEEQCHLGSIEDQARFAGQSLRVHNYFRHIHGSPPLEINEDLVREALEDVKERCTKGNRRNKVNKNVGENFGSACNFISQRVSVAEAVTNWYREVCDKGYKFEQDQGTVGTSKFTQLIWQSTDDFGIAFATKKTKENLYCTYVVAKYSPAGNKPGSYKENVLKGSFTPSICDSLNTIALNAAMAEQPVVATQPSLSLHDHWSFGPHLVNQVLKAVSHEAGAFEPFKMPIYHKVPNLKPSGRNSKRCKNLGTDNPICRAEIEDEGLRIHNYLRKVHAAKDLQLSPTLSLNALQYAKTLLKEEKIRSSDVGAGESINVKCSEELTVSDAIKSWYKEVCSTNYDFTEEGIHSAGHFTQIVWQSTQRLGIGKATGIVDGVPCTVVVARYEPPGNVIGKFRKNVKQGEFTKEFCSKVDQIIDSQKTENAAPGGSGIVQPSVSQGSAAQTQPAQGQLGQSTQVVQPTEEANQEKKPSGEFGEVASNNNVSPTTDSLKNPIKLPEKNKGINPKAAQKHPSKTLKGETKPGAKQEKNKPLKKPAKVLSIAKAQANLPSAKAAKAFSEEGLKTHNVLRSYHLSNELKLVDSLSDAAQKRCKDMIETGIVSQGRRRNMVQKSGENLVILCDTVKTEYSAKDAIMNWYSEACDQKGNFVYGSYAGKPNHFTQMIWKSTKYLGMAKVDYKDKASNDFCSCVVAIYEEPGNYLGKVKENVKQGFFDQSKCPDQESMLTDAEVKYNEKKKEEKAAQKPIPPKKPSPVTTKAPATVSTSAPTTVGPPGAASNSDGMPTPTSAIDVDAPSPTPVTQFTLAPSTAAGPPQSSPAVPASSERTTVPPTTLPPLTTSVRPSLPESSERVTPPPLQLPSTSSPPTSPVPPPASPSLPPPQSSVPKPTQPAVTTAPTSVAPPSLPPKPSKKPTRKQEKRPVGSTKSPTLTPSSKLPIDEKGALKPSQTPPTRSKTPVKIPEAVKPTQPKPSSSKRPTENPEELSPTKQPPSPTPSKAPIEQPGVAKPTQPPSPSPPWKGPKEKPEAKKPVGKPSLPKPGKGTDSGSKPSTQESTEKPENSVSPSATRPSDDKVRPTTAVPQTTVAKVTSQRPSEQDGDFEKMSLDAHNKLRQIHSSPPMTLDKDLSKSCAEYAMQIAEKGMLEHSDTKDGENLAVGCSKKNIEMSGVQATKNWYKEVCSPGYQFEDTDKATQGTGHFTQVVWKKSTVLGIGRFTKNDKKKDMFCTYIVARYREAGNWQGQYAENVVKGTFDLTSTCDNLNKILGTTNASKKGIIFRNKQRRLGSMHNFVKKTTIVNEQ